MNKNFLSNTHQIYPTWYSTDQCPINNIRDHSQM